MKIMSGRRYYEKEQKVRKFIGTCSAEPDFADRLRRKEMAHAGHGREPYYLPDRGHPSQPCFGGGLGT